MQPQGNLVYYRSHKMNQQSIERFQLEKLAPFSPIVDDQKISHPAKRLLTSPETSGAVFLDVAMSELAASTCCGSAQ
jgi:hypothetical protein